MMQIKEMISFTVRNDASTDFPIQIWDTFISTLTEKIKIDFLQDSIYKSAQRDGETRHSSYHAR